jgi:hypothetical protein
MTATRSRPREAMRACSVPFSITATAGAPLPRRDAAGARPGIASRDRRLELAELVRVEIALGAAGYADPVLERLEVGEELYGPEWASRSWHDLCREMAEEAADIGSWGVLALQAPPPHSQTVAAALVCAIRCGAGAHHEIAALDRDAVPIPAEPINELLRRADMNRSPRRERAYLELAEDHAGPSGFALHAIARLAAGDGLYGSRWATLGLPRLIGQVAEECVDLSAWALLTLQHRSQTAPSDPDSSAHLRSVIQYGAIAFLTLDALGVSRRQVDGP